MPSVDVHCGSDLNDAAYWRGRRSPIPASVHSSPAEVVQALQQRVRGPLPSGHPLFHVPSGPVDVNASQPEGNRFPGSHDRWRSCSWPCRDKDSHFRTSSRSPGVMPTHHRHELLSGSVCDDSDRLRRSAGAASWPRSAGCARLLRRLCPPANCFELPV